MTFLFLIANQIVIFCGIVSIRRWRKISNCCIKIHSLLTASISWANFTLLKINALIQLKKFGGYINFHYICINKNNKIPLGDLVKYGYIQGDENGKIYNPAASKEEYKDVTDCEFYIETIKNVAEFHICEMNESGKPICPNGPQIEKCYELKLAVDGGK